ncbi:hypothetical protein QDY71_09240 [Kingella negevensis]|uniref:Uncharacterized protein n=1 Tax=Kingella negevensis TaxID=1522312 RepID=A0A238TBK7_9NEIS|nr:hypothetical protein [Kingella negevensis]MDK4680469.1 hypothetical protein [Kingella negevensis]MDK4681808.1 hypothetical protein [Kingella negevensis]MDK4690005.1 hypothetical protein [Kingella negevensis]MDK4692649.1 hypothetical protein [Kingella negevensis]MDK4697923.1 hypothetical protein [Kingella negevensis]
MSFLKFNIKNRLWQTFWLQGVLISQILWAGFAYLRWGMEPVNKLMIFPCMIFLMIYTAWICRKIFVAGQHAENPEVGVIAQYLTVAWALNTTFILGFIGAHVWQM